MKYYKNNMNINYVNPKASYQMKISWNSIAWVFLGLQVLLMIVMEHTIFYQIITAIFMAIVGIQLLKKKSLDISKYYILTFVFILFNILIVVLGIAVDKSHSIQYISTITFNLLLFVMIYNFFLNSNDLYKFLNVYVNAIFVSSIILLVGNKNKLLTERLSFTWRGSDNSFLLLGIRFFPTGPNAISNYCVLALLFSILLYIKYKEKRQLLFCLIFLLLIILTGSRKGFIFLVISMFLLLSIYYKGNKRFIYIIVSAVITTILYVFTQKNDVLFTIIGNRLHEFVYFVLKLDFNDASIATRQQLIDSAINYIKERPILGYGMDAYRVMSPFHGINIDNNFLEIIVSSGIIGFIIYYAYVPLVLYDYFSVKILSKESKIFFSIFIICLIMQYGAVTYYGRFEGIVFAILYYTLKRDTIKNYEKNKLKNNEMEIASKKFELPISD